MQHEPDEDAIRDLWDRKAADWDLQVGDDGDSNRILNSDPVLWELLGDVRGRRVLDAGCGTGYLTRKLARRGAVAVGVDVSPRMIEIARRKSVAGGTAPEFAVDSCAELSSQATGRFDLLVANYVLMDVPDLDAVLRSFARVLRRGGDAVVVFSHPCFPQGPVTILPDGTVTYRWSFCYFDEQSCVEPPWGHFQTPFVWFHRPLSAYWEAFVKAGFEVVAFREPRIEPSRYHLAGSEARLRNSRTRPYSVAFKLRRGGVNGAG